MSDATVTWMNAARNLGLRLNDQQATLAAGTQAGAVPVNAEIVRVAVSAANGSLILPAVKNGDSGERIAIVVNESANAVLVFPFSGELMNNVANASLSVAAGAVGIFVPSRNAVLPQGAGNVPGWRGVAQT